MTGPDPVLSDIPLDDGSERHREQPRGISAFDLPTPHPQPESPASQPKLQLTSNGDPGEGPYAEADEHAMASVLHWALDALQHPSRASADWLARDIDPTTSSIEQLLTSPTLTLEQARQAKNVYKTMRIVGERAADRRIGARMYVAAIAAALVRFNTRISTQSSEALSRGFQGLLDDRRMPRSLRDLAGSALCRLRDHRDSERSRSA